MSNDLWRTPPEVIKYIENRFGNIELDLCASNENKVCEFYLDESDDFLKSEWLKTMMIDMGSLAWLNPPYSAPLKFVEQAVKWSKYGYGVAMILNNDPSTKWFEVIESHASIIMPIVGGRIAFLDGDGEPINGNNKPQVMVYFAPFGNNGVQITDYVHISEIYPNGKPKRKAVTSLTEQNSN